MSAIRPLAAILDDDQDFLRLVKVIFQKMGFTVVIATTVAELSAELVTAKPELMLIDLNFDGEMIGFNLVRKFRHELGPKVPIFVISALSEFQAIAHALEVGANDFIVKPIDKHIFATKVSSYFNLTDVAQNKLFYRSVPNGGEDAKVSLSLEVEAIDELGIRFISKHLLSKGATFWIDGEFLKEIIPWAETLLVQVTSTWVHQDGIHYGAYVEFDPTKAEELRAVRQWLLKNPHSVMLHIHSEK